MTAADASLKWGTRRADDRKMVARSRLSTVSYVLLGAVEAAGTCTPYDLKRSVAARLGPLHEIAHSQYYDETARLARLGLLEEHATQDGRRRLLYAITPEGRRELLRWLRTPDYSRPELRDVGLVKLAFADPLDPDELGQLARDQLEVVRGLRDELVAGWGNGRCPASEPAAPSDGGTGGTTIELNLAVAEALVAFWERLADRLPVRVGLG